MFVRNVVTLIAATVLVIGAICNDARAQTSSDISTDASAKALEVLRQAFQCPLPNYHSIHNSSPSERLQARSEHLEQRTNRFSGTKSQLIIAEEQEKLMKIYTPDGNIIVSRSREVERASVRWVDIDDVADHKDYVAFTCRDNKDCISKSDVTEKDDVRSSKNGRLPGFAGTQNYVLSHIFIKTCDADTATNIRAAAEYLIKLNGGNIGQFYKVRKDVVTGVLNMRTEPNASSSLVVAVPAGTANVRVNRCRSYPGSNAPWCEAEWQGNKGWMSGCCMVNAKTGKLAREKADGD